MWSELKGGSMVMLMLVPVTFFLRNWLNVSTHVHWGKAPIPSRVKKLGPKWLLKRAQTQQARCHAALQMNMKKSTDNSTDTFNQLHFKIITSIIINCSIKQFQCRPHLAQPYDFYILRNDTASPVSYGRPPRQLREGWTRAAHGGRMGSLQKAA